MRLPCATLVGLAILVGRNSVCYADYDDYGGEDGGEDSEGGYGGGYGEGGGGEDTPPPSGETQELLTLNDFEAFVDNNDASVIAAVTAKEITDPNAVLPEGWDVEEDGEWEAPTIEHPLLNSFNSMTGTLYGYRFAFTSSPEVLAKLKCKNSGLFLYRSPKFVSVKDGDRPRERFPSDKLSESSVANWLASKAQPLVGLYSFSTKDRYKGPVLVIFMYLDFDKNMQGVTYVLKRARKVATRLKGKGLAIAVAALSDMSYEISDYGLTSTKPTADILMGIRAGSDHFSGTTYIETVGRTSVFSGDTLGAFADAYLRGELSPYVKPVDPPPSDAEDEPADFEGDDSVDELEDGSKDEM